jgi:hypothetical protein
VRDFDNWIHLKFDWVGVHFWSDAPAEQSWLRHPHRHRFYAEVSLEVKHDDRELEFFRVLDQIHARLVPALSGEDNNGYDPKSCEQMAEWILDTLLDWYGDDRQGQVLVLEDNENGGGAQWQRIS